MKLKKGQIIPVRKGENKTTSSNPQEADRPELTTSTHQPTDKKKSLASLLKRKKNKH